MELNHWPTVCLYTGLAVIVLTRTKMNQTTSRYSFVFFLSARWLRMRNDRSLRSLRLAHFSPFRHIRLRRPRASDPGHYYCLACPQTVRRESGEGSARIATLCIGSILTRIGIASSRALFGSYKYRVRHHEQRHQTDTAGRMERTRRAPSRIHVCDRPANARFVPRE